MEIVWNGVGSAWSRLYGNASAMVEYEGFRLLIDCGHTVPARLATAGVPTSNIHAIFISHLHGDHVYGLEEVGFRGLLITHSRPRLLIARGLIQPLWDHVLSGSMSMIGGERRTLDDYFDVLPMVVGSTVSVEGLELAICPVQHGPGMDAYGIKVKCSSGAASFTCDTVARVNPWFYEGASVVFHDCSFHDPFPGTVHTHLDELRHYSRDWRERTFLVHYGDTLPELRENAEWERHLAESCLRLTEPLVRMKV
jgi:hydroxyacylglutathione hydrolase